MTAAEHYIEAEKLLAESVDYDESALGRECASEYRELAALHFAAAQIGATILATHGYKGGKTANALLDAVTS